MSRNRYKPYLYVLFEDAIYKEIFFGFRKHSHINSNQVDFGNILGGWKKVETELTSPDSITLKQLKKFPQCMVLALIDSDGDMARIEKISQNIPPDYQERVFIMSSAKEAEDIIKEFNMGKRETIGHHLAQDCTANQCQHWQGSAMLKHNLSVIMQLQQKFSLTMPQ